MTSSLYRPNLNGMPGKPPVTRITIARGAKDYDSRRIPELVSEKSLLTDGDKPVAPIRFKKLENRTASKEIRSSFPVSPVARVDRQIEEKQRRLNLWDKDLDQRDREILDLREKVSLLERLNSKMQDEKDEKQAKLMSLQLLMSQREAEKRELEHIVSRLEIQNSRIEDEVSTKEAKLKSLFNEINQREQEKTELREEVSALRRQRLEATESREQKELRLKELEVEIAGKERESRELKNKVFGLENLTENIEKEKEEKQEKLAALEQMVHDRERERIELEQRVVMLEARNRQIEEEKREKEERLKELEAQQTEKDHTDGKDNGRHTPEAYPEPQVVDTDTEGKLRKLEELEAAMLRHEAEREELQQLAKYLQQRNVEMDMEREEKQHQLTELQLAVAKKDTENYELKQKLLHLENIREKFVEREEVDGKGRSDDLQKKRTSLELEADDNSLSRERSLSSGSQTLRNLQETSGADDTDESSEDSLSGRHSAGSRSQGINQNHRASGSSGHSNKPTHRHSPPPLPTPSLAVHTTLEYIAETEDFKYKFQQKYMMKEQEVQEKHVYLPEEKDTSVQENDIPDAHENNTSDGQHIQEHSTPDAPYLQDHYAPLQKLAAPDASSPQEYDTPDTPAKICVPGSIMTNPQSFESLTQGGDLAAQHEESAQLPTAVEDRSSASPSALQQEIRSSTEEEGEGGLGDERDDEETEEEAILSVTEEEITRTKQKLEQIEIEVVKKKAESAYLRKSVEDLLSMMEAADEEDDDQLDDDLDLDSEASSSDESDEYFVEVDPMDPNYFFRESPILQQDLADSFDVEGPMHKEDATDGVKTPSTARASPNPEDISDVKIKLEKLERDIMEKKAESERIKRTMDDLKLQKMVAAEEKKLTKQKLDDLQQSEAQLKQLLAILQLRRATESEETLQRLDDYARGEDEERREGRVMEVGVGGGEGAGEAISEEDRKALRDAIVY